MMTVLGQGSHENEREEGNDTRGNQHMQREETGEQGDNRENTLKTRKKIKIKMKARQHNRGSVR